MRAAALQPPGPPCPRRGPRPARCAPGPAGLGDEAAGRAGGRRGAGPGPDRLRRGGGGAPPARHADLVRPAGLRGRRAHGGSRPPHALRLADDAGLSVHLYAVRGARLRRLGLGSVGRADLADDGRQPGRARPGRVADPRRAGLGGQPPAGRGALGDRGRAVDRAGAAHPAPRPGRTAADGTGHRGSVPARPALVQGGRDRRGGRRQAGAADLHSVPDAHPPVPPGRGGHGDVRRAGRGRLPGAAAGLLAVVVRA
jgi:hypothetical protein